MVERYIFTVTTGRSGTAYLAELLARNLTDAAVFHERTGWSSFGVVTPDLSDFTLFNSVGNVEKVQTFWRRKFAHDGKGPKRIHAEASHLLAKAGLLENIGLLTGQGARVDVVLLRRDVAATVWSFYNRFDFVNNGLAWLFYLDLAYPNVIVSAQPFREHGVAGRALWYIVEMRVRAAYYRELLAGQPGLRFHDVGLDDIAQPAGARGLLTAMELAPPGEIDCPAPRNENPGTHFGPRDREALGRLTERFVFDADELARRFIASGRRLGDGPPTARR